MSTPYDDMDKSVDELKKALTAMLNQLRLRATAISSERVLENQVKLAFDRFYDSLLTAYFQAGKKVYPDLTKSKLKEWLEEYYVVTEYVFKNEWERKKERFLEMLFTLKNTGASLSGLVAMQSQRRSSQLLSQQIEEYGIFVIDKAIMAQYEKENVKRLKWVTQKDKKVCAECRRRSGRIYDIDEAPPKAHYGCRCYYVSAGGD